MKDKLLLTGIVGAAIAALCCFTPFLAVMLPALGMGWLLSYVYNDAVLLPVLALFLILIGVALWRRRMSN